MNRKTPVPRVLFVVVWAALSSLLLPGLARATGAEEELQALRREMRAEEDLLAALRGRRLTLVGAMEGLDREIQRTSRELDRSKARRKALRQEVLALKKSLGSIERQLEGRKRDLSSRLVLYYRLGRTGVLPVVFSDVSLPDKLRSLDALKRILVSDWDHIQAYHDSLSEWRVAAARLKDRMEEERENHARLEAHRKALSKARQDKKNLVMRVDKDSGLHQHLLGEMHEREEALKRTILEERPPPRLDAAVGPIEAQKGRLPWPVRGTLHRGFGNVRPAPGRPPFKSHGIDIRTDPEEPVRAIWGGEVRYAGWFRGYGQMVIIQHGEQDFTVLSHLNGLTKRKGERAEAGEVVGHAGETGSTEGCLVHFEVWHGGQPVDPLDWIRPRARR